MVKYNNNRPCINCKVRGPQNFVYNEIQAELCCIQCGAIQTNVNYQFLYGDTMAFTNPVHSVRHCGVDSTSHDRAAKKGELDRQGEIFRRMNQRFCKDELSTDRREKKVDEFAEILSWSDRGLNGHESRVTIKAKHFFITNELLRRRRPTRQTIAATLIISKRECGDFVDVDSVAKLLAMDDLGSHVLSVCKILKLSHRSRIEQNIPGFVTRLGFPYRYTKYISKLFNRYSKENGSLASNTIMALILKRFYDTNKAKSKFNEDIVDLEYISNMTGSSVTTIKAYMTNGCSTIYKKQPKRQREDDISSNKKIKV